MEAGAEADTPVATLPPADATGVLTLALAPTDAADDVVPTLTWALALPGLDAGGEADAEAAAGTGLDDDGWPAGWLEAADWPDGDADTWLGAELDGIWGEDPCPELEEAGWLLPLATACVAVVTGLTTVVTKPSARAGCAKAKRATTSTASASRGMTASLPRMPDNLTCFPPSGSRPSATAIRPAARTPRHIRERFGRCRRSSS